MLTRDTCRQCWKLKALDCQVGQDTNEVCRFYEPKFKEILAENGRINSKATQSDTERF